MKKIIKSQFSRCPIYTKRNARMVSNVVRMKRKMRHHTSNFKFDFSATDDMEDDDDTDDDDDEDVDGEPILESRSIKHRGGVNRIRVRFAYILIMMMMM